MKKVFMFLFAVLAFTACQENHEGETHHVNSAIENPRDGMFIHVTSDDPHRVLMAMQMAEMISEDHDVVMYFDIDGVKVLLDDAADLEYAQFPSSHSQIKNLIEKGITIMACPGCLKAAGHTPEDLMEGITVANKETFFNFTKGRIITLDY